jgi:hypothetical protein
MKIRCEDCKYWTPLVGGINCGVCYKLAHSHKLDIVTIVDSIRGGYVYCVTTESDFFCALFDRRSNTNE